VQGQVKASLLSSGPFRSLQGIDLLFLGPLNLLHVRRHGATGVLPLLRGIGKTAAELPRSELQHPRTPVTVFYDRKALTTTIRASRLFHEQALNARFLRLTLHKGISSLSILKVNI
jgi:hypothetical protein